MACPYCYNSAVNVVAIVYGQTVMRCNTCDRQFTPDKMVQVQPIYLSQVQPMFVQPNVVSVQQKYGFVQPNYGYVKQTQPVAAIELRQGNGVQFQVSGMGKQPACSSCSYNLSKFGGCPCGAV